MNHTGNGKTILVTGSTDGIGLETAKTLAKTGATILLHGRNSDRLQRAIELLKKETGNTTVQGFIADFSALANVQRLAADLNEKFEHLDVLINNAGVFLHERKLSADGFEMTFAVNHLAPMLLTHQLLPLLKKAQNARVVTVSSIAHRRITSLDDLQSERRFDGLMAYSLSKLCNIYFSDDLAERLKGTTVTSNCLHPGGINTKLLREGFGVSGGADIEQGAATSVYLASSPNVEGVSGKYFDSMRLSEPTPFARDAHNRKVLIEKSEAMLKTAVDV